MSVKCVLFDLDGTLVKTGGAGLFALNRAFDELYGVAGAMDGINPSGKTDPAIIREIFEQKFERECLPIEMQAVQDAYLSFLPDECAKSDGYEVIARIPELLETLKAESVLTGLGTGNLERGARIKLERAGLNPFLPFGGYGSDSEVRADLLRAGHRRAEEFLGAKIDPQDVFVVGDTELDILAARQAEFPVIAVATGFTAPEVLKEHSPDHYLDDFGDGSRFMDIVLGRSA